MPNYQRRIVYLSEAQREELFSNGSITVNGTTITYDANDMYVTPQEEPYVKPASGIPASDLASGVVPDLTNYVQKTDYATTDDYGLVKVGSGLYVGGLTGKLAVAYANSSSIKNGTNATASAPVSLQHESAFYALAKAAGDTTQSQSSNAVGTYTADAKAAIQTMLGVPGDIQVNETSIVSNGVANVPKATSSTFGVVKLGGAIRSGADVVGGSPDAIYINPSSSAGVKNGTSTTFPLSPSVQHISTFYGLAKAAGDTTQSQSSNEIGVYTSEAKTAIQTMLGVESGVSFVETVSGATPSITGEPNTRYMCGEVTSITIAAPSVGTIDIVFTSGSTPAVLTVTPPTGMTIKWPAWFDPTSLATNTTYEINIMDGVYGAVMAW